MVAVMDGVLRSAPRERISVLHVCSDFHQQTLYTQLVRHLSDVGISQRVYIPVRSAAEAAWRPPEIRDARFHVRQVLRRWHRALFRSKIRTIARDLMSQVDLSTVDLVHAHFLYSDGAVALELKRRLGLPYIVAVRNTDINVFMRYRPDLRRVRDEVLREASQVVFVSPAYRDLLLGNLRASLRDAVAEKTVVIPNGVDASWLANAPAESREPDRTLRLLYVGMVTQNKNVTRLLRAVALVAAHRQVSLTLVGEPGDGWQPVERMLASGDYDFAKYVGRVDDVEQLRRIYRQHDVFVMPSFTETFGLAYVEALSQGLPIIHSHGQGVDGYFERDSVSEAIDPVSPTDIARGVEALAERADRVRRECVVQAQRFAWPRIIESYRSTYARVSTPANV